ncbi:hypothetical protein ACJX0J_021071 [Zea mays]
MGIFTFLTSAGQEIDMYLISLSFLLSRCIFLLSISLSKRIGYLALLIVTFSTGFIRPEKHARFIGLHSGVGIKTKHLMYNCKLHVATYMRPILPHMTWRCITCYLIINWIFLHEDIVLSEDNHFLHVGNVSCFFKGSISHIVTAKEAEEHLTPLLMYDIIYVYGT